MMRSKPYPRFVAVAAVAIVTGFITGACGAKEVAIHDAAPMSIQDVFGHYQLVGADLPTTCRLTLDPVENAGRLPILVSRCGSSEIAAATHWRMTRGGFDLVAKRDSVLIGFHRIDVDHFEGRDAAGRIYRLERAPMV